MSLKSKLEKNFSDTAEFIKNNKLFDNLTLNNQTLIMTVYNQTQRSLIDIAEEIQVLNDKISKLK